MKCKRAWLLASMLSLSSGCHPAVKYDLLAGGAAEVAEPGRLKLILKTKDGEVEQNTPIPAGWYVLRPANAVGNAATQPVK